MGNSSPTTRVGVSLPENYEMAIEAFKEGLMSPKVYRAATVNMILQHEKTYHPSVVMSNEVAVIPPMDIDTNLITNSSALISVK